jgi:DNA-binding GntR family transcriptional regulator
VSDWWTTRGMKMGTPREFDGTRFAYERLRNDVLLGRLAPGTPLSQVRIANELGIGRGPLREGTHVLRIQSTHEGRPA